MLFWKMRYFQKLADPEWSTESVDLLSGSLDSLFERERPAGFCVSATFKVMINAVWQGGNKGISSQVLSRPWFVMEEKPTKGGYRALFRGDPVLREQAPGTFPA